VAEHRGVDGVDGVIFDWGGTLTPWHTIDLVEQWSVYARGYSDHPDRAAELAARILAIERDAWQRGRTDAASARLTELLAAAGVDRQHPQSGAAQRAYEEFWEPHTLAGPDVEATFRGLRERGLRVGVLSNTIWSRAYHERVFARDGLLELIDAAVYSCEIEHVKPHPEAFLAAIRALGLSDPTRCVYVGDRAFEDIHGAQQVGMRAVLVPHSDIPADQQVRLEVRPDAVAHRLLDVLRHVDGWLQL
jgi:putative hydrolase of the HAD superfamily